MSGVLKLRGEDSEDLKVISAHLQDAIVPLADMAWLPEQGRFVLLLNRFRWEKAAGADSGDADDGDDDGDDEGNRGAGADEVGDAAFADELYERVHCGVAFDGVTAVRCRCIDRHDRLRLLSLLCITCADGALLMHFSGGGCIRLEVGKWVCHVEDIGEPWPTGRRPAHVLSNDVLDTDGPAGGVLDGGGAAKGRAAG
jgi:hypothetical protein